MPFVTSSFLLLLVRHLLLEAMHLFLIASYPPPRARARKEPSRFLFLVITSASLVVTSALLVVTGSYYFNFNSNGY